MRPNNDPQANTSVSLGRSHSVGDDVSVKCAPQRPNQRNLNFSKGPVYWLQTKRSRSLKLHKKQCLKRHSGVNQAPCLKLVETFLRFYLNQIYLTCSTSDTHDWTKEIRAAATHNHSSWVGSSELHEIKRSLQISLPVTASLSINQIRV